MEEQRTKVVFSYESKFNIVECNGSKVMLEEVWEPLSNHVVSKNAKHIGRSILICGCMSWEGIGEVTKIKGKIVASIIKLSYMTT